MSDTKRFDEWTEIDCNECSHYWDNSCDSPKTLKKGSKTLCNSFVATRSVIIPQKLKRLERAFKWILACVVILGVVSISSLVLILLMIFGVV